MLKRSADDIVPPMVSDKTSLGLAERVPGVHLPVRRRLAGHKSTTTSESASLKSRPQNALVLTIAADSFDAP